jgi:hypothetical protein
MVSYLATATLAVSLLSATPQPVKWQDDYGKALQATRAGSQPLLVVLDEPAQDEARLEPALLGEGEISGQEFELLQPYHLCHVDVTTEYGERVAKAFKAKNFPYTAIIDKSGSVIIFAKAGQMSADEWHEALKSHRDGQRPDAATSHGMTHVSYKLSGDATESASPEYVSPNYCPSCQRRSM